MDTWHWDFGDGNFSSRQQPSHSYAAPGNYRAVLIASTSAPCYDTFYRDIIVDTLPVLNPGPDKTALCPGDTVVFSPEFTTGLTALHWDFGDGHERENGLSGTVHVYEHAGVYPVIITGHFRACPDMAFTDTITVYPPPPVNLGDDTSLCPGDAPLRLSNLPEGKGNDQYRWSTGTQAGSITIHEPGLYWLQVISGNECAATDSVTIHRSCYLDIPNVFTPNGDGRNDYFYPRGLLSRRVTQFHMQVFNRWGQLVYETRQTTDGHGWDGAWNGQPVQEGVYVYYISAWFRNDEIQRYQGNMTLLR